MSFCRNCGTQLAEGSKFCPSCGTPVETPASSNQQPNAWQPQQPVGNPGAPQGNYQQSESFGSKMKSAMDNVADTTAYYDPRDIEQNKVMALLSYLGILVLIPIFAAKESKFARFHANQGLVLFIVELIYYVAYFILSTIIVSISYKLAFLCTILSLVSFAFLYFMVVGIINAANGKAKELPFIGNRQILK